MIDTHTRSLNLAQGDYETFQRFPKQRRTFNLSSNLYIFHVVVQLDNMSKEELIKLVKRQLQSAHKAKSRNEGCERLSPVLLLVVSINRAKQGGS